MCGGERGHSMGQGSRALGEGKGEARPQRLGGGAGILSEHLVSMFFLESDPAAEEAGALTQDWGRRCVRTAAWEWVINPAGPVAIPPPPNPPPLRLDLSREKVNRVTGAQCAHL